MATKEMKQNLEQCSAIVIAGATIAYLGQNNKLPVIISSTLDAGQEWSLVDVLGKYRKAIGWTMADIKGINPSICMHKILLEDCYSNSVEQ